MPRIERSETAPVAVDLRVDRRSRKSAVIPKRGSVETELARYNAAPIGAAVDLHEAGADDG
ncbi:MAG: hypothetical protein OES47_00205 [Acidobacteriota bacterium]|nr:hypothetical protein [Acidobacteriota bacterium]